MNKKRPLGVSPSKQEDIDWIVSMLRNAYRTEIIRNQRNAKRKIVLVLTNSINPVYYRALAARLLGLLMQHDRSIKQELQKETSLVDSLNQIIQFCKHFKKKDEEISDVRKINLCCTLVISMLMQGSYERVKNVVTLDSELLDMNSLPVNGRTSRLMDSIFDPIDSSLNDSSVQSSNWTEVRERDINTATSQRRATINTPGSQNALDLLAQESWEDTRREFLKSRNLESRATTANRSAGSPFRSTPNLKPLSQQELRPISRSRSVLFGTESGTGLDTKGRDVPLIDSVPQYIGYDVPKVVYPYERPTSDQQKGKKKESIGNNQDPFQRRLLKTAASPKRKLTTTTADYVPKTASLIRPSGLYQLPKGRPFIMQPNHLLRAIKSADMPLQWPPKERSSSSNRSRTGSRISRMTWTEWKPEESNLSQSSLLSTSTDQSQDIKHLGFGPEEYAEWSSAVPEDLDDIFLEDGNNFDPEEPVEEETTALVVHEDPKQFYQVSTPAMEELGPNVDIKSSNFKRNLLLSILHLPISSVSTKEVNSVAKLEHTSTMTALGYEIHALQKQQRRLQKQAHKKISKALDKLPLKYLFRLPGGVGFCRERMQRAMGLWVEEFELNQQRAAWLQWKAFIEAIRYKERSVEYYRQAGIKRLEGALERLLLAMVERGWSKWKVAVQTQIWLDRDAAVRLIQKWARRYLGYLKCLRLHDENPINGAFQDIFLAPCRNLPYQIPVRIREDRRRIWRACISVQAPYRGRRFRRFMARQRRAAIRIQSIARMRIAWNSYRKVKRQIILLQAAIRRRLCQVEYHEIRSSAILIQVNYRGLKGKRLRRSILLARRRAAEQKSTAAYKIQRIWHGHLARAEARAIREQHIREFWAALVFQRCWYQYNDDWVTFLLLGCLRERGREEKEWEEELKAFFRNNKARHIQREYRRYRSARREYFALRLQCGWRCYRARVEAHTRRTESRAKRKLRWWARVCLGHRNRQARTLQFWWLHAYPGRFLRHLLTRFQEEELQRQEQEYERRREAATRIQALAHGVWTREWLRQVRGATNIQRVYRGYCGRKLAKAVWKALRTEAATTYVNRICQEAYEKEFNRVWTLIQSASIKVQRYLRGSYCRSSIVQQWVHADLLLAMSIRIQRLWRKSARVRFAKKMLNAQRRRLSNPYKDLDGAGPILEASLAEAQQYFDPSDAEAGLGIASWLHFLGADNQIELFYSKKLTNLRQLRELTEAKFDETIAVRDKKILYRIKGKLFGDKWTEHAKAFREQTEIMEKHLKAQLLLLEKAERKLKSCTSKREAVEDEFEKLSQECSEFRRPPRSLRLKLEAATTALENLEVELEEVEAQTQNYRTHLEPLQAQYEQKKKDLRAAEKKEMQALNVRRGFQPFDLKNQSTKLHRLFVDFYSGHEERAEYFSRMLQTTPVTSFMLDSFFHENNSAASAKANVSNLINYPRSKEMQHRDTSRRLKCCDILQYAAERIADLFAPEEEEEEQKANDEEQQYTSIFYHELLETMDKANRTTLPQRPQVWRACLDQLNLVNKKAKLVQRVWKGRATRMFSTAMQNRSKLESIQKAYLAEQQQSSVQATRQALREKEAKEYEEYLKQQELEALEYYLASIPRYPWEQLYDEANEAYYYHHPVTNAIEWECEGYTLEDDTKVRILQRVFRGYLSRLFVYRLKRWQHKQQLYEEDEKKWWTFDSQRRQLTTTTFAFVDEAPSEQLQQQEKELKQQILTWENQNRDFATRFERRTTKEKVPVCQIDNTTVQMEMAYRKYQTAYHTSLRKQDRVNKTMSVSSRPPNVHASSLIDLLQAYRSYTKVTEMPVYLTTSCKFTRSYVPLAWQMVPSNVNEQGEYEDCCYYWNDRTNEVTWTEPSYTFEEEYAARKLQSIFRMKLGRKEFQAVLNKLTLDQHVQETLKKVSQIGYIGLKREGLSLQILLNRLGCPDAVGKVCNVSPMPVPGREKPASGKYSLENFCELSSSELKGHGIASEEDLEFVRTFMTSILPAFHRLEFADTKFHFLSSAAAIEQLLLASYPNQRGRVASLASAIQASESPITRGLLQMHLQRYEGKPKLAQDNLPEILHRRTCNTREEEEAIFRELLRASTRMHVHIGNWKIQVLQAKFELIFRFVQCHVGNSNNAILTADEIHLLPHYLPPLRGYWEHSYATTGTLAYEQCNVLIRLHVLDVAAQAQAGVIQIQKLYRGFLMKKWYQSYRHYQATAAITIQCCWRLYRAQVEKVWLQAQQQSDYDQLWSDELQVFYYFYHSTEESFWEPPVDQFQRPLPYRPLVKDRRSGRMIKAWPSLDAGDVGPIDFDASRRALLNLPESAIICDKCQAAEATRICNYCYGEDGGYVNSCFACFVLEHQRREDMSWHTFNLINKTEAEHLRCVECTRLAERLCFQCEDCYCERCYERIHRRGHRSTHGFQTFPPACEVCIECERAPATCSCDVCEDPMCEKCFRKTHARGKKHQHTATTIVQILSQDQEYCQQCEARTAEKECEFCKLQICQTCLEFQHHLTCPPFAAKKKRQELMKESLCVECSKPADRECEACGDKYCSVRWMGNPGCFERFHSKGNRAEHEAIPFEAPAAPRELRELDKEAQAWLQKRKEEDLERARRDKEEKEEQERQKKAAEEAEAEAKRLKKRSKKQKKLEDEALAADPNKRQSSPLVTTFETGVCETKSCKTPVFRLLPYCPEHCTPQTMLLVTRDPLKAAQLVADAQQELAALDKAKAKGKAGKGKGGLPGLLLKKPVVVEKSKTKSKSKSKSKKPELAPEN